MKLQEAVKSAAPAEKKAVSVFAAAGEQSFSETHNQKLNIHKCVCLQADSHYVNLMSFPTNEGCY